MPSKGKTARKKRKAPEQSQNDEKSLKAEKKEKKTSQNPSKKQKTEIRKADSRITLAELPEGMKKLVIIESYLIFLSN